MTALSAELVTAKAESGTPDLTKWVPVETYNAIRRELAEVTGKHSTVSLSAVLDKAETEGRIFKSERAYFEQVGAQVGVVALSAQLDAKQPIAALTALQTATTSIPDTRREGLTALSADEKSAAKALGMSEAEYQKLKEEGDK